MVKHTYDEEYEFTEGVIWEDNPWIIQTNYKAGPYDNKCKHGYGFTKERIIGPYLNQEHDEDIWFLPRIIIVKNEGGYNSTGLCLDCLLESIQTIK